MMIVEKTIDVMIGKTTTDKMIDEKLIDKITETIIDQIMEKTIKEDRDIKIEVKGGRILEIIRDNSRERFE